MICDNCGLETQITFGNSCPECEVSPNVFGEIGEYCEENMHLHCHSKFDYDCCCGCHDYFNNGNMASLRKPMTEEYFFMMIKKGELKWVQE